LVLAGTWVTPSGARAFMDRLPGCVLHGEFRTNARRFEAARRTRDALTLLIRRVVPRHPVTLDSSEEELVEVLDRLFPKGTGFSALRLPGDQPIASVMAPPWHDELAHAYPLVRLLLAMPRNAFLRITLPGGSTFTVSWIAERGRERRRPAQRLGN
jgi:hypothetical protein